jgi:cytochrome c peroxidase
MHDGSLKTLEEVIDYYDKGGIKNKNLDEKMKQLKLTAQEKKDLVAFLKSLSGEGWQHIQPPSKFPE